MPDSILDPLLLDPTNLAARDGMLFVQRVPLLCTRKNPTDQPTVRDVTDVLKRISRGSKMRNELEDSEGQESSSHCNCCLPIQI